MKRAALLFFAVVISLTGILQMPQLHTHADSFSSSNIIDDSVFDNTGTMSAAQIDSFLNGFSSSCISSNNGFSSPDTTGYSPAPGGFTFGGNVSAGRVIYDSALAYGLNPQVLLTTLQKEQSLVTGTAGCHPNTPDPASSFQCNLWGTGNIPCTSACPYSGGCVTIAVGYNCPGNCQASSEGFSQQVIRAAWKLKFAEQRSEGNIGWDVQETNFPVAGDHWNNSDDPNSCYTNYMTQGYRKLCPTDTNPAYFDGYATIDGVSTHMDSGATAALYSYTPHFRGNQSFFNIFEGWFGSTHNSFAANSPYAKSACNIPAYTSQYVGRLYNPDRKDFLFTTNDLEACLAIRSGYIWDGIVLQNYAPGPNTEPVYRLGSFNQHVYTSSLAVKQDYINNKGFADEGIGFYAQTASQGNISVYCMVSNNTVTYTSSSGEVYLLQSEGYNNAGIAFYTGQMSTTDSPVYRLSRGPERLYTTNGYENEVAQLFYGFTWEVNSTMMAPTSPGPNFTPVYRLSKSGQYFFTANRGERDIAVVFYGFSSEGTGFYASPTQVSGTVPVYRLTDSNGNRLFTESAVERDTAINTYGYQSEGIGWYSPTN